MSWVSYAMKRSVISAFILLGASVVIFSIVRLVPGDPVQILAGSFAQQGSMEALRHRLGLDQPFWVQYFDWLGNVLVGDWGRSVISGTHVTEMIANRYPRSLELAILGMLVAIVLSFPIGIIGGVNQNSPADYLALFFSQTGVSLPSFWLGTILILVFGKYLNVLPPSGYVPITESVVGNLTHAILPALSLGIINAAIITRYLRSELLEEVGKDYIRTAKAFGHPRRRIVGKYLLRNALIPTVTVLGIQFGYMIGGIVIIEKVFAYPGLGQLIITSLLNRDYPVIQMSLLVLAATFIVINFFVDLVYGWINPQIKY